MPLDVKIGEHTQGFEPRSILCQATITNMKKAANPFDNQNGMFNLGPDFRWNVSSFICIHVNVALHAKIPLIAFSGLMHLGIAFLVLILC